MDQFRDRFDEKTYENGPTCSIGLFDTHVIPETEIQLPVELLSRVIKLGQAYNLHYLSRFDIFDHVFLESNHCEGLSHELIFLKEITNDKLLHTHLDNILSLAVSCMKRDNCKLLVNGN